MLKNIIAHNVSNVFIINLRKRTVLGFSFSFHNCHVEMFQNFLKILFKKTNIANVLFSNFVVWSFFSQFYTSCFSHCFPSFLGGHNVKFVGLSPFPT